jgi:hypothetical protein
MRANGTHVRQITDRGGDPLVDHRFRDTAPTWSPTATRLAFERIDGKTNHHALCTVRLDGTGLSRITPWRLDAAQPDWSRNADGSCSIPRPNPMTRKTSGWCTPMGPVCVA